MGIEGPRKTAAAVERAPAIDETEVFSRLHHPAREFDDPQKLEEFAHHLGEDLTKCEAYPFYRDYIEEKVPTLDMLGRTVELMKSRVAAELKAERERGASEAATADLAARLRLLEGRMGNLRRSVRAYVQTVARFHEIKARVRYDDPDWRVSEIEKIDAERRRVHDSVLKGLNDLVDQAKAVREEGLTEPGGVRLWERDTDAKSIESRGGFALFGPNVIADRTYIRDWAIAADMHMQMQEFEHRMRELSSPAADANTRHD